MNQNKTKILVLHTSVGGGIRATAENVAEQLENSGRYEVRNYDTEKVETGAYSSAIRSLYLAILDHFSSLWGFLYDSRIVLGLTLPLRKFFASFKYKKVLQILREFQPAIVISTGVVPSGIMAYIKSKGWYRGQLVIVFSDYHLQRFWLYREADFYICNIREQMEGLQKLGVPKSKIGLTGTMIAEKFTRQIARDSALSELKMLTSVPLVLVGGAGRARTSTKEVFLQLLRSPKSFQVAVICGNNRELKEELSKITAPGPHPVKILGFVANMETWMSAAKVLVYKTGGPSMAEAVVKKLPIVFVDVRPGHEQKNLEYLVDHGLGQYARIPREAVFMVEQVLEEKVKTNWSRVEASIVNPPGRETLVTLIDRLAPQPMAAKGTLNIKHYQE
jgi:processive 1,2-diacylglycerol beta-glucosyltransferase